MNMLRAFDETIRLADLLGLPPTRGKGLGLDHLRDMRARITADFSEGKLGRWLGWAQCAVVAAGIGATLEDMKYINKICADDVANDNAPFDVIAHLRHQAEWSEKTFGPGDRRKGVIDHIRKELGEIEDDPDGKNECEWIDVIILAFDGAWRSGKSPEEIVRLWRAKQAKNEARDWPDWRTADPNKAIEHVRVAA